MSIVDRQLVGGQALPVHDHELGSKLELRHHREGSRQGRAPGTSGMDILSEQLVQPGTGVDYTDHLPQPQTSLAVRQGGDEVRGATGGRHFDDHPGRDHTR